MKKSFFLLPLLVFVSIFVSCEKEVSQPDYPIVGLWIGTYDVTGGNEIGTTGLYYSFNIRQDSTVQIQSVGADGNTYYSSGKWTLEQNTFKARITTSNLGQTGAVQDVSAAYNKTNGTLTSGQVRNVGDGYFTASFSLSRIN